MAPTKKQVSSPNAADGDDGVSNLLDDSLFDSRKRGRRSNLLPKDHTGQVLANIVNDDELEKKRRKEDLEQLEKEKTAKADKAASKPSPFNMLSNLTPSELEDHYVQCIKMCNQNKVNQKNAFKLQLIDYMKMILATQNKKIENLSLMSCTLDASAKIYSYRVDKVFSDMMKVMSGKVWTVGEESEAMDGDDDADKDDAEEFVPKKKKKCDKEGKDANIDLEKMLWSEARLDKSEADAELTNFINYGRSAIPANAEFFLECPISEDDMKLSLNGQLFNPSGASLSNNNVLKDFVVKYKGKFDSIDYATSIPGYMDMCKDDHNVTVVVNNNLIYDKNSHLIPESLLPEDTPSADNLADDLPMVDYDDYMSDDDAVCIQPSPLSSQNTTRVGQLTCSRVSNCFSVNRMSHLVSTRQTEYSFFDDNRLNFVVGPVHWSIKNQKSKPTRPEEVHPPKSTKKEGKIDFTLKNTEKLNKLFNEPVKAQLASKTMKTWCKTNYSVPVNIYNQRDTVCLFSHKDLIYLNNSFKLGIYQNASQNKSKEANASLSPEDFLADNIVDDRDDADNCDDVRDDCDHNEEADDRIPMLSNGDQLPPVNVANDNDLDLVPAPPKVNKISIKYAKVQKRVDIKLLKAKLWESMNLDGQEQQDEKENKNEAGSGEESVEKVEIKLSEIYKELPRKLPADEAAQLSFPIVFMAVLHMANERTLKVTGNEDYSDVYISKG